MVGGNKETIARDFVGKVGGFCVARWKGKRGAIYEFACGRPFEPDQAGGKDRKARLPADNDAPRIGSGLAAHFDTVKKLRSGVNHTFEVPFLGHMT